MQIVIWGADQSTTVLNVPLLGVPIDPSALASINQAVEDAEAAAEAAQAAGLPESAAVLIPVGDEVPSGWVQVGSITGFLIIAKTGGTPAPTMLTAPTATPGTVTVGDNVTVTLGTWSNGTPTGVLMQGGVDRTSEITDGVWSPGVAGAATWAVTATGPGGTLAAPVVNITVDAAAAGIDYTQAALYVDADSAFAGTDAAVGTITNIGNGGYDLTTTGSGSAITHSADGFTYANGVRHTAAGVAASGIDGTFIIVRATVDSYVASSYIFAANPQSGFIAIFDNNGNLQARYNNGSTVNIALGSTPYGTEFVVGIEVNNETGAIRTYDLTGTLASVTPSATPGVIPNTINMGMALTGTVHQAAIFTKPIGGAFAASFEDVFADFTAA